MRLFVATPINFPLYNSLKSRLSKYVEGKWVEGWNLHLTHYFIGEDDAKKYEIKLSLPKDNLVIYGVGIFNNILYLKVKSNDIDLIAKQFKNSRFFPHITLCRIKKFLDKEALLNEIKEIKFNYQHPFEVFLYSSTLTNKGPIYKKIYKY